MKPTHTVRFAAVALALAATTALAQEETLRAVNFLPNNQSFGKPFVDYVNLVNAAGKGRVQINILPSGTMSPFDMGVAIKNGAVDMGNVPATFFQNLLPVGEAVKLGNTNAAEQRASGAFDFLDKLYHEKVNAKLISIWGHEAQFHTYLRAKPVETASLAGMKMRTTPIYRAFFRALGADLIQAPPGEVYTLLERGAVDGYGWPLWDIKSPGWDRVTKYRIEPGYYAVTSSIHVNLDKWKKLNKAQQDALTSQALVFEKQFAAEAPKLNAAYRKDQDAAGVQAIELKGAEREKYLRTAYEAGWEEHYKLDRENAEKLRNLIEKK